MKKNNQSGPTMLGLVANMRHKIDAAEARDLAMSEGPVYVDMRGSYTTLPNNNSTTVLKQTFPKLLLNLVNVEYNNYYNFWRVIAHDLSKKASGNGYLYIMTDKMMEEARQLVRDADHFTDVKQATVDMFMNHYIVADEIKKSQDDAMHEIRMIEACTARSKR